MVTTMDVREFIKSNSYDELLNKVTVELSLKVNPDTPPSQVFNIDAGKINKSGIGLGQLEALCSSDSDRLVKFVKMTLEEITDDDGDDDRDEEERDELIEVLPFYKSFLIGYLIRYYYLKNDSEYLLDYLKILRIPGYKKYANELKDIYSRL